MCVKRNVYMPEQRISISANAEDFLDLFAPLCICVKVLLEKSAYMRNEMDMFMAKDMYKCQKRLAYM